MARIAFHSVPELSPSAVGKRVDNVLTDLSDPRRHWVWVALR